jgi:phage-related minor tail protein
MKKKPDKKFRPESQFYNEPEFYREKEFYREALKFVLKNLNENCVERRKIEKGLEEIRREFNK